MPDDYDPLVIFQVHNPVGGSPEQEYVELLAVGAVDLAGYALVDRDFSEGAVPASEFRRIYVFPALHLRAGDVVWLRTGVGENKTTDRGYGRSLHDLYWGAGYCVWQGRNGDQIALVKYTVEFTQTV